MKLSNINRVTTLAAVLAAGTFLCGSILPAQASDGGYVRAEKVSLVDLDLSTIAGQEAARERLHRMARQLCTQVADELDLSHQSNFLRCLDAAAAQTQPHLNAMIRQATDVRTASLGQMQR